jgi:outer membrane biosynthesis protein TonB
MKSSSISKVLASAKVGLVILQVMVLLFGFWVTPAFAEDAGYALAFDGTTDYVELAQTALMLGPGWEGTKTVNLWVKPTGATPVCGNAVPAWCDAIFGDRPRWWGIARGAINGVDRIWVWNYDGSPGSSYDVIGIEYTAGEWVQISLVHGDGRLVAYKNGVEMGNVESGLTQQPSTGAQPVLHLGGIINNASRNWTFEGEIDEVRLWGRALSAEEIQQDMNRELVGDEAGLAAYYRMSDGAGLVLTDDSVNDWNGMLKDGSSSVPGDGFPPAWVISGAFGSTDPTPTPTPTEEPTPTPTEEPTLTPTPTEEPTLTPTPTEEPTLTPTPTEEPTLTPTPTEEPTPTPPPASDAGYALAFDGTTDYVELAQTALMLGPGWEGTKTVNLWVKPTGATPVCGNAVPAWCDAIFGDRPRWWGIARGAINGVDRIWVWNYDGSPGSSYDVIGIEYTAGEWVQISLVHGDGRLVAYKNGVEMGNVESGLTQQPSTGAQPVLHLGGIINNATRNWTFEGEIDEVRLWGRVLSVEEIQQDMNRELVGDEAGLAAYYRMSDGAGLVLTDDSVNDWNGTLKDGSSTVPGDGFPPAWVISGAFGSTDPTPTPTPTEEPTPTPTEEPTLTPTEEPTLTPTEEPTPTPTEEPTPTPTEEPTLTPTEEPTLTPTEEPTPTPTEEPTPAPTEEPTPTPPPASDAGYALAFDGTTDYVELAQTALMLGPGWEGTKTVNLWVKPTGVTPVCGNAVPAFCDAIFGDRPRWWGIARGAINGVDRIWVWNYDGSPGSSYDMIGIEYTAGEWVQISLVHGVGRLVAYKNGVEMGNVESGLTQQPNTGALPVLHLGGIINNATRNWTFEGEIDEVRLWGRALSAEEIQQDMNRELVGDEAGLAAYYRMSDGAGLVLTDDSVNDWNGTLKDGSSTVPGDGFPPAWVISGAFYWE